MTLLTRVILRFKKKTTVVGVLAIAIIAFALLGAGGWYAHARTAMRDNAIREVALTQQDQLNNGAASKLNKSQSDAKSSSDIKLSADSKPEGNSSAKPTSPAPKYLTSPDPRSTAYSTTPPTQNPASFITKITRPGQVPAGTLISYNATKGDKTYYGGDLALTPSVITLSKSTNSAPNFLVSLPDGRLTRGANLPWDEQNQIAFVAFQGTGAPDAAASVSQILQLFSSTAPNGTYQIHMIGGASNPPSSDGWEYDGFLTLIVTD